MWNSLVIRIYVGYAKNFDSECGIDCGVVWFITVRTARYSMELKMKKLALFVASVAVLASTSVFAQGKTRAEVYQELVEAQQNGLNYVTDASYPDVSPAFQGTVAYLKQQALAKAEHENKVAKAASDAMPNN